MLRCPPESALLGRQQDLSAVSELLEGTRLVTITGMGGIGKTTVALALRERFDATLVDLQTITEGEAVTTLVASTLNVTERSSRSALEQLCRHLANSDDVLILDNCEHVIADVVAMVHVLLQECPDLRILTTSTERLGLDAEYIYDLDPLTLPEPGGTLAEVREADASRLFRERARQVDPHFEIGSENLAAVVDVCRRLDGLPLAIELAAARLSVLSVGELARRLDRRFALLTTGSQQRPPRHQTLRALVEWSYEKCSPAEKILWARLSVFGGSFRLEAAEDVCGFGELDRDEILDLLDGLVVRSVLTVDRRADSTGYRQLATIRDFGGELLTERDEVETCRQRLFEFALVSTRQLVADWQGPDQGVALATWRREHGTLMSVLSWAMASQDRHDHAAELLSLLRYHWVSGGWLASARYWFDQVLASSALTPLRRGHALAISSWVHMLQGNTDRGTDEVRQLEELLPAIDDRQLTGYAAKVAALVHLFGGDLTEAVQGYRRAIAICREVGDDAFALSAAFQLAMAQAFSGDDEAALETCAELIEQGERTGEQWNRAYAHWIRGVANVHLGHLDVAEESIRQVMTIQLEFEDGICTAVALPVLAWVFERRGDRTSAIQLTRAAASVFGAIGTSPAAFGPHYAREFSAMDRRPNPDPEPLLLSTCEAAHFGAEFDAHPQARQLAELSDREQEVFAELVDGRSNREIARKLVISQRTAEGHVHRILNKLGLRSRAEVASWHLRQLEGDRGH